MAEHVERNGGIAVAAGPIAAITAAGMLARFRDDAGSANVALVLAIIVIAAALAGRVAGAATAVVAALSYNFFHTQPYNSLRIDHAHDVVTVVLLVLIGIGVGELSQWRRRLRASSQRQHRVGGALEAVAELVASQAEPEVVWHTVRASMVDLLGVDECRFERGAASSVPVISSSGALVATNMHIGPRGFRLPATGVAIPVVYGGVVLGHIVVAGNAASPGSSLDERRAAIAMARQYAVSLGTSRSTPAPAVSTVS